MLSGVGNASKALGKIIGSVPILRDGSVDEWLQEGGEWVLDRTDKRAQRAVEMFSAEEKTGCDDFVDSIRAVSVIANQTTAVLFDGEAIYLAAA